MGWHWQKIEIRNEKKIIIANGDCIWNIIRFAFVPFTVNPLALCIGMNFHRLNWKNGVATKKKTHISWQLNLDNASWNAWISCHSTFTPLFLSHAFHVYPFSSGQFPWITCTSFIYLHRQDRPSKWQKKKKMQTFPFTIDTRINGALPLSTQNDR